MQQMESARMAEKKTKPRAHRVATIISATLVTEQGQKIVVRVRNFSETGLGISADQPLRIGEVVLIELRNLRMAGEVVRRNGNLFGIRVDSQINIDEMTSRQINKTKFEVSDMHKIADKAYRPSLISRKPAD